MTEGRDRLTFEVSPSQLPGARHSAALVGVGMNAVQPSCGRSTSEATLSKTSALDRGRGSDAAGPGVAGAARTKQPPLSTSCDDVGMTLGRIFIRTEMEDGVEFLAGSLGWTAWTPPGGT
jgi:hypothetical protein